MKSKRNTHRNRIENQFDSNLGSNTSTFFDQFLFISETGWSTYLLPNSAQSYYHLQPCSLAFLLSRTGMSA